MPKLTSTNSHNKRRLIDGCPMTFAFTLLGNRWRPIILWNIIEGWDTAADLHRAIPLISRKMLFQELKELAAHGLIEKLAAVDRRNIPSYKATLLGQSLESILYAVHKWGKKHRPVTRPSQSGAS